MKRILAILAATIAIPIFASALSRRGESPSSAILINDGRIDASVLTSDRNSNEEGKAAKLLAETLEKCAHSGSVTEGDKNAPFRIFIRKNPRATKSTPDSPDGTFRNENIFAFEKGKLEILYGDSPKTAIGEFLRRYCGVEFFAAGAIGTEIPKRKVLSFSIGRDSFIPSYTGRHLLVGNDFRALEWFRINGGNSDFATFAHGMNIILDKDTAALHPDWLAKDKEGKPRVYSRATQADFYSDDFRNFAAIKADDYFSNNPEKKILSIGIADSGNFDMTEKTLSNTRGFSTRGYADFSDTVFSFTNYVARRTILGKSDKFLMQLAYLYTENPPSFDIEKNVAIYIATDAANRAFPEEKLRDDTLYREWSKTGTGLFGIYSYNYGQPYFVPREITLHAAEAIKSARNAGALIHTGESSPVWAYDAHKLWIIMRLLKDSSLSPRELECEFFGKYYAGAAKYTSNFFAVAERAWNRYRGTPRWLKLYKRQSQAELLTQSDIYEMENQLKLAERAACSAPISKRVREIRLVFEVTKSLRRIYLIEKRLWNLGEATLANSAEILNTIEALRIARKNGEITCQIYSKNTLYPAADFSVWKSIDYLDISELRAQEILKLGDSSHVEKIEKLFGSEFVQNIKQLKDKKSKNLLVNPSFENGFFGWNLSRAESSESFAKLSTNGQRSGNYCATLSATLFVGMSQIPKIDEGNSYTLKLYAKGNVKLGNTHYARLMFLDKNGQILLTKRLQIPSDSLKNYTKIEISAQAPIGATHAECAFFSLNCAPDESITIDDFSLTEFN